SGVPADAEVMTVDARGGVKSGAGDRTFVHGAHPVRRLPLTEICDVHCYRARDTANGEISRKLELARADLLDRRAFEKNLWMIGDIQEVGAHEVSVALGLSGPQLVGVNDSLGRTTCRIVGIKLHRAFDVLEVAAHPGDHHVARAKLRCGVPRFKSPF